MKHIIILSCVFLCIQSIHPCDVYNRKHWKHWKHWIDADKDCENTRQEVLIRDSKNPVVMDGCKVIQGYWHDPYSGKIFTDPKKLDIDHVVPLKEAYQSGAYKWTKEKKRQFANSLSENHLLAVSLKENRSKSAQDPAEWLPTNKAYRKEYAKIWVAIKLKWNLTVDRAEYLRLQSLLGKRAILPPVAEEYHCRY